MKKIVIFVFFAAALAAFSQQAPQGGQKSGRSGRNNKAGPDLSQFSPEMIEQMKARRAEMEEKAEKPVETTEEAPGKGQENFDEIMGSFSELAMKFSEKDSSDMEIFVYECQYIGGKAFSRALEPFLSVNGELSDCEGEYARRLAHEGRERIADVQSGEL
jgi:hypothetical protein